MTDVGEIIAELGELDVGQLRERWFQHFGNPPMIQSADVLRHAFADRLQRSVEGADAKLDKQIAELVSRHRPGHRPKLRTTRFKPGARLERLWKGERYQVEVLAEGFRWNGTDYKTLSQVAREITGTRWNGPRFFGLRDEAA